METEAERFADLFGYDGQIWTTKDGNAFMDLLEEFNAKAEWRDGFRVGEVIRHTFADGSVILETGGGWDLGYSDCFCMNGAGHNDDCEEAKP